MEALAVYLPTWSADYVRRRRSVEPSVPVILTRIDRERTIVAGCCRAALTCGVRVGMALADAQVLLDQEPVIEPLDSRRDRRELYRLALWMYRLAPIVTLDGDDGLLLDVRGCERLYGGTERIAARIARGLRRARVAACVALAPTVGSAWGLARFGGSTRRPIVVAAAGLDAALNALPVAALRLDADALGLLHEVGIERVGQLRAIPLDAIAARYGTTVLTRLYQALGTVREILIPIRPKAPLTASMPFDGPTDRIESIVKAARKTLDELTGLLRSRSRGSLSLLVELDRSDLDPCVLHVRTARPCNDPRHLWKLLDPQIQGAHLGYGVEGVRLTVLRSRPMQEQQGTCWSDDRTNGGSPDGEAFSRMIDTIVSRLGVPKVVRPVAVQSHLPECAFACAPVLDAVESEPDAAGAPCVDRPTVLWSSPSPIDVSLLSPDGPLMTLRLRGDTRIVVTCIGPERIEPEWWRADGASIADGCRDYYKVQLDDGRWLWVFRTQSDSARPVRWFVHGEWA